MQSTTNLQTRHPKRKSGDRSSVIMCSCEPLRSSLLATNQRTASEVPEMKWVLPVLVLPFKAGARIWICWMQIRYVFTVYTSQRFNHMKNAISTFNTLIIQLDYCIIPSSRCIFKTDQATPSNNSSTEWVDNPVVIPSFFSCWLSKDQVRKEFSAGLFSQPKKGAGKLSRQIVPINWVVPLPSNSDHQDYYILSRGSL